MAKKTMKEVLLKVWFVFSNLYLFKITIDFFIGKADTVAIVCMIICYSVLTIHLISSFILFILVELTKYKEYKKYEDGLEYLKFLHKARYKSNFTGTREDVENYSKEIERYGNAMINLGEHYVERKVFHKNKEKRVKEIINRTKELMATN